MADFRSSRAIIVGINSYGSGVPVLRSPVSDATKLKELLANVYGYTTTLLTDQAASLEGLRRCFEEELPRKVETDDRVLVYFAGHGVANDGEDGPTGALLPQDADAGNPASFLAMETFRDWLGKLSCRHLLVVLDCCFAGAFRWTRGTRQIRVPLEAIHRERYERFTRNPAWQAIASTAYNQEALDAVAGKVLGRRRAAEDNAPNSPFALALLDGLEGKADLTGDGVIMAHELATFLRDRVSEDTDNVHHDQMPCIWSLGRNEGGEFIFLLPGRDPADLPPAPELKAENNPYRGLRVYEESDAGLFFGRDRVVEELAGVVARQPLTVVLGASGTGKSSLVRAGLLAYPGKHAAEAAARDVASAGTAAAKEAVSVPAEPEVAGDAVLFGKSAGAGGGAFHRLIMRPADAPSAPLPGLVARLTGEEAAEAAPEMTPAAAVAVFAGWFAADAQRHLLLVIDQLEELVTLCTPEVRSGFLEFLAGLIETEDERLRVVVTLRSDFEPQFHETALRRYLLDGPGEARFLVPPLQHDELREIIEKPASQRVLFFQPPALVDRLITEVIQMPGALPLLSFALSELYLKYVARQQAAQAAGEIIDRTITEDDYRQLGGVIGALGKRANEEYAAFDPAHQRTMRKVMLRMVATEGELARRRVPRSELVYPQADETGRATAVVERLETARLLVSGRSEGGDHADGEDRYVEPAHDALVRSWGTLLEWQRDAAAELPLQRQLTEAADEWQRRGRASGLLWTADPRLPLVRQQLTSAEGWLNTRETEFVAGSTRRKRQLLTAGLSASVAVVALVAIALIWWRNSQVETKLAESSHLARSALSQLHTDSSLGRAIAAEAMRTSPSPEAVSAFRQALLAPDDYSYGEGVMLAKYSPDGKRLATGRQDGLVEIWSLDRKSSAGKINVPGTLNVLAFSPGSDILMTAGGDSKSPEIDLTFRQTTSTIRLWDPRSPGHPRSALTLPGNVFGAAFSPDGSQIAISGSDCKTTLWNWKSGLSRAFPPHGCADRGASRCAFNWGENPNDPEWAKEHVTAKELDLSVAFINDERYLLTGGGDCRLRMWNLVSGNLERQEELLNAPFNWIVVSPDGKYVLAASGLAGIGSNVAFLWDLGSGQFGLGSGQGRRLQVGSDRIYAVAFSADSSFVALGNGDRKVYVHKTEDGTPWTILSGHEHWVGAAAFHPSVSRILVTAGACDGTARVWDIGQQPNRGHEILRLREPSCTGAVEFNRAGTAVLVIDQNSGAHQRPIRFGTSTPQRPLPDNGLYKPGWLQRGELSSAHYVLSFDKPQMISLENKQTNLKSYFSVGGIKEISFSHDGRRVLTAEGYWDVARIWDAATAKTIRQFRRTASMDSAELNSSDELVLTATANGTAVLWDVESSESLGEFGPYFEDGSLIGAKFDPAGGAVILWSDTGEVLRFPCDACRPVSELARLAQDKITFRSLTAEERYQYLGEQISTSLVTDITSHRTVSNN